MAAKGGAALARPPQAMALLRGAGHVQQPGVVARQLSPADPCAKEQLIEQAASCEGRCGRPFASPAPPGRSLKPGTGTWREPRAGHAVRLVPVRSRFPALGSSLSPPGPVASAHNGTREATRAASQPARVRCVSGYAG